MSTTGQFSTKSPTIKRILKEASELSSAPSSDYSASPLESNLFEWHFTIRGPPAPSPFDSGLYHGRIVLPPSYPLRPPSFRFLTPSGRFEPNREICLSISGFHEESWQPAWGIRTALVAIRSFMDSDAGGQVGGMTSSEEVRRRLASESLGWRCGGCGGRTNEEMMREQERLVQEVGKGEEKEEAVPEELRLGYKDELGKENSSPKQQDEKAAVVEDEAVEIPVRTSAQVAAAGAAAETTTTTTTRTLPAPTRTTPAAQAAPPPRLATPPAPQDTAWIDKAIIGVGTALAIMVFRMLFL